jgi:hypothetical protein
MYADLFNVARTQRLYGKATQPSLLKRPRLWEYEGRRLPTVEQLESKAPPRTQQARISQVGRRTPLRIAKAPKKATFQTNKPKFQTTKKLNFRSGRKRLKIT